MPEQTGKNVYDDGNIPEVDLPSNKKSKDATYPVEPLPESTRSRKTDQEETDVPSFFVCQEISGL